MKTNTIATILLALILGCSPIEPKHPKSPVNKIVKTKKLDLPGVFINKKELNYNPKTSLWLHKEKKYSGYALSYYLDSSFQQKTGILNGLKQNEETIWYQDGHIKKSANYHLGKLEGAKKNWSADSSHFLVSHLNYHLGKLHGVQKKWYPTGELFKVLNLDKGQEKGMQKAYRKNGALFANYEAREGRIFGLKRAALCFGLEEENIQYEK